MENKKPLINEDGTPFNMAMLYYVQIDNCMREYSKAIVENDFEKAMQWLNEMFNRAVIEMSEKEEETIKSAIDSIESEIYVANKGRNKNLSNNIHSGMRLVMRDLLKVMHKHHMIMPNIKLTDGFKKIRESYGIK